MLCKSGHRISTTNIQQNFILLIMWLCFLSLNSAYADSAMNISALSEKTGCGSCHKIPGINSAQGQVGPPLTKYSHRGYIAGILPNNINNLTAWLLDPQSFDPKSAMPKTGLTQDEALAFATYLLEL